MSQPQEELDFMEKQRENVRILQIALSKCRNKVEWKKTVKAWSDAFDYDEVQTLIAIQSIKGGLK